MKSSKFKELFVSHMRTYESTYTKRLRRQRTRLALNDSLKGLSDAFHKQAEAQLSAIDVFEKFSMQTKVFVK